jgi:hypothetical protein
MLQQIDQVLANIKTFIPRFNSFEEQLALKYFQGQQQELARFFLSWNIVYNKTEEQVRSKALSYNIFNIIRYGHYENRLHSPFLTHLLNPEASHLQGRLYINLFLNHVYKQQLDISSINSIVIKEEHSIAELGRIDIFITFRVGDKAYFIAIENKIHAEDQPKQLERYYQYLKNQTQDSNRIKLIYLTKYGDFPLIPGSINLQLFNDLYRNNVLQLMSYKSDISAIINTSLCAVKQGSVKEILVQYLETIESF